MADAYSRWLDIPAHLRPPTYYQLLGVAPSELDRAAIAASAERQLARLRPHLEGPERDECRRIEQEVVQARDTLLDPVSRQRYDLITPDATQPWWKPEDETALVAPMPVEGWWQSEAAPDPAPAPEPEPPAKVETVPVEGWWQSEAPEPNPQVPAEAIEPPMPAPTPSSDRVAPSGTPAASEKRNDWWRKKPDGSNVVEVRPSTPVVTPSPVVEPPKPVVPPPPESAAPRPIVSEKALAYTTSTPKRPLAALVAFSIVMIAAGGTAVLVWKKPWQKDEPAPTSFAKIEIGPMPRQVEVDPLKSITKGPDREIIDIPPRLVEPKPKEVVKVEPKPKETSKEEPKITEQLLRGHQGAVYSVAISPGGRTILSVSDDRSVLVHKLGAEENHRQIHRLLSPGVAVVFCNGARSGVFCDGGDTVVYDFTVGKVKASFENPRGGIRSLAAASDGSYVLTGTTDGCIRWWSVPEMKLVHTLNVDDTATVSALAISMDGKSAALGLSDGRLCIWNLEKRREVKRWKGHKGGVSAVAFSPDGKRLASAGDDSIAIIWQTSGTQVKRLLGHDGPLMGVAWCSDGQRVLTGGIDKKVLLWNETKSWKMDWSFIATDKVYSLAVDARDRYVLAGQSNGTIKLVPLPGPKENSGSE